MPSITHIIRTICEKLKEDSVDSVDLVKVESKMWMLYLAEKYKNSKSDGEEGELGFFEGTNRPRKYQRNFKEGAE